MIIDYKFYSFLSVYKSVLLQMHTYLLLFNPLTTQSNRYIIVLTEPTTPLNNADQGGLFCLIKGKCNSES